MFPETDPGDDDILIPEDDEDTQDNSGWQTANGKTHSTWRKRSTAENVTIMNDEPDIQAARSKCSKVHKQLVLPRAKSQSQSSGSNDRPIAVEVSAGQHEQKTGTTI